MKNNVIELGDVRVKKIETNGKREQRMAERRLLFSHDWEVRVDKNGRETGIWFNVMLSPIMNFSFTEALKRALSDEHWLINYGWHKLYTKENGFVGWINAHEQVMFPVKSHQAMSINNKRLEKIIGIENS